MARQISGEDPSIGGSRFRRNLRLSATLADATWGHCWPTDAMSPMGGSLGDLAEISRQCATSCETRTQVGVAKFGSENQRRSTSYIRPFGASRLVTEQDSNFGSPRGRDCIECAGLRRVFWLIPMRVRAWKITKQPCATLRTLQNPNVFEGFSTCCVYSISSTFESAQPSKTRLFRKRPKVRVAQ